MPQRRKTLSYRNVKQIAFIYLALPLVCFFIGYLRWYLMLVCCGSLVFVLWRMFRDQKKEDGDQLRNVSDPQSKADYSLKTVFFVFAVSLLWTYLGGMNGYYYQSWDWAWRNAIYFDLIEYQWPVIYPQTGSALVYYFGHWLPPATLAKGIVALTGSLEIGMTAGRMILWLWSSVGLTIIILMLFHVLQARSSRSRFFAVLLFIFFSGMDVLGAIKEGNLGYLTDPTVTNWQHFHLERWCQGYEFSSVTTCVYWVFNQAIIPWMITLNFLEEESPANYVFYCVVCLLCGTLPCVGLAVLMVAKAIAFGITKTREKRIKQFFLRVISLQNLVSFVVLFPMIAAFILSCNTARFVKGNTILSDMHILSSAYAQEEAVGEGIEEIVSETAAETAEETKEIVAQNNTEKNSLLSRIFENKYFIFLFLEVGCYMLLVWCDHRKDYLFYVIGLCFLIFPYIHIGQSNDFCMRATIPALFILMVYTTRFLLEHFPTRNNQKNRKGESFRHAVAVLLAVAVLIGSVTPLVEMYRGIYNVTTKGTIYLEDQRVMTFRDRVPDNFACSEPEDHFFFKYLAR